MPNWFRNRSLRRKELEAAQEKENSPLPAKPTEPEVKRGFEAHELVQQVIDLKVKLADLEGENVELRRRLRKREADDDRSGDRVAELHPRDTAMPTNPSPLVDNDMTSVSSLSLALSTGEEPVSEGLTGGLSGDRRLPPCNSLSVVRGKMFENVVGHMPQRRGSLNRQTASGLAPPGIERQALHSQTSPLEKPRGGSLGSASLRRTKTTGGIDVARLAYPSDKIDWSSDLKSYFEDDRPKDSSGVAPARASQRHREKRLAFVQEVLSRIPLLQNLERRFLAVLALKMNSSTVKFMGGHLILKKGDIGSSIFVIWKGEVLVDYEESTSGRDESKQKLKRGAFFGVSGLMEKHPRTASIKALTDVEVFVLEREEYTSLRDRIESQKGSGTSSETVERGELTPYETFMEDRDADIMALRREIGSARNGTEYVKAVASFANHILAVPLSGAPFSAENATVEHSQMVKDLVREAGVYVNGCFLNCNDENDIERLTTQLKSLMQSEMLESKIPSHQMDSFVTMILRACCRTRTGFVSFEMIDSLFGSPGRLLVKPESALTPALRISMMSTNTVVIEVVDVFQIMHVDVEDTVDPEQWCLIQAAVTEELTITQTCESKTFLYIMVEEGDPESPYESNSSADLLKTVQKILKDNGKELVESPTEEFDSFSMRAESLDSQAGIPSDNGEYVSSGTY